MPDAAERDGDLDIVGGDDAPVERDRGKRRGRTLRPETCADQHGVHVPFTSDEGPAAMGILLPVHGEGFNWSLSPIHMRRVSPFITRPG